MLRKKQIVGGGQQWSGCPEGCRCLRCGGSALIPSRLHEACTSCQKSKVAVSQPLSKGTWPGRETKWATY